MKFLGWTDSGVPFHIYSKAKPKFKAGGMPDWAGVKLRDNPIYGAFFRAMGASTHAMDRIWELLDAGYAQPAP